MRFDKHRCRWASVGDASEVRRSDERCAILDALGDAQDPLSSADIAKATGMASANVRQLLGKRVASHEVSNPKRGEYVLPDHNDHNSHNDRERPQDPSAFNDQQL